MTIPSCFIINYQLKYQNISIVLLLQYCNCYFVLLSSFPLYFCQNRFLLRLSHLRSWTCEFSRPSSLPSFYINPDVCHIYHYSPSTVATRPRPHNTHTFQVSLPLSSWPGSQHFNIVLVSVRYQFISHHPLTELTQLSGSTSWGKSRSCVHSRHLLSQGHLWFWILHNSSLQPTHILPPATSLFSESFLHFCKTVLTGTSIHGKYYSWLE